MITQCLHGLPCRCISTSYLKFSTAELQIILLFLISSLSYFGKIKNDPVKTHGTDSR